MAIFKVGITGHTNIADETRRLVAAAIAAELGSVHEPFNGLTSLVPGADQVFAWPVRAVGGDVVLVQPSVDIANAIPEANLADVQAARSTIEETAELPYEQASEQVYDAGAYVADLLIAVWDGEPSGGLGGTCDIVKRRQDLARPLTVIWPAGVARL